MYRVNHIMRTINEMNFYTPHMRVDRFTGYSNGLQKISFCILLVSFYLLVITALIYGLFDIKNGLNFTSTLSLYFVNIIAGGVCLLSPLIGTLKYIYNFKGEIINELIYDIDNDEQYIEVLMPYSLEELIYASKCIRARISKVKSKCFFMGSEGTSVISILCLSYSGVCVMSGVNVEEIGLIGFFDMAIKFVLFFMLHLLLINTFFKRKLRYLQKLKSLIDMTVSTKKNFIP
ncbi:hypothetical protein ACUINF_004210 [Escherichia coli]